MEKERKIKVLSIIALVVAILGLTVAFAALSETLTINGTASVDAAEWDIHFENLDTWAQGGASVEGTPAMENTTITDVNFIVTKPGDYAQIEFNIINNGTVNAKIDSVEISKLCTLDSPVERCDWDNDGIVTQTDIEKVNTNLSLYMVYMDDTELNGVYSAKNLKQGDILNAGEKRHVTFALIYGNVDFENKVHLEANELPKRDLQFNDLSITINYVQAD